MYFVHMCKFNDCTQKQYQLTASVYPCCNTLRLSIFCSCFSFVLVSFWTRSRESPCIYLWLKKYLWSIAFIEISEGHCLLSMGISFFEEQQKPFLQLQPFLFFFFSFAGKGVGLEFSDSVEINDFIQLLLLSFIPLDFIFMLCKIRLSWAMKLYLLWFLGFWYWQDPNGGYGGGPGQASI